MKHILELSRCKPQGEHDMNKTYPRTFSHIGISVPDLEKAVKFYTDVLGWYLIMEPTEIIEDNSPIGEMALNYSNF